MTSTRNIEPAFHMRSGSRNIGMSSIQPPRATRAAAFMVSRSTVPLPMCALCVVIQALCLRSAWNRSAERLVYVGPLGDSCALLSSAGNVVDVVALHNIGGAPTPLNLAPVGLHDADGEKRRGWGRPVVTSCASPPTLMVAFLSPVKLFLHSTRSSPRPR